MYVIGVEGGGTKSTLCLANIHGQILKTYSFGALNLYSSDRNQALLNLHNALLHCIKDLNSTLSSIGAICIGGASLGRPLEKELIKSFLRQKNYSCKVKLVTDAEIALIANANSNQSILLIAGTGSLAIAFNNEGELLRCGGWGHIIGDEGSAYDIGKQGLNHALKYYDKYSKYNCLLNSILETASLKDVNELIPYIYLTHNKTRIANIAKIVANLAQQGDNDSIKIIKQAADSLVDLTHALITKTGFSGVVEVICQGSVLLNNDYLYKYYEKEMTKQSANIRISKANTPAVFGAIKIALSMLK